MQTVDVSAEEQCFLDAIDANPRCMTTRLVYADWLQEHDRPEHEGWRALVACGLHPWYYRGSETYGLWHQNDRVFRNDDGWFDVMWRQIWEESTICAAFFDAIGIPKERGYFTVVSEMLRHCAGCFLLLDDPTRERMLAGDKMIPERKFT